MAGPVLSVGVEARLNDLNSGLDTAERQIRDFAGVSERQFRAVEDAVSRANATLDARLNQFGNTLNQQSQRIVAANNSIALSFTQAGTAATNQIAAFTNAGLAAARTQQYAQLQSTLAGSANQARATGIQFQGFSRVLQDAAFGPGAIANNLEGLNNDLRQLRQRAAESGQSVTRTLIQSLAGGGGLNLALGGVTLALSLASFGLSAWTRLFNPAKKAITDVKDELAEFEKGLSKLDRGLLKGDQAAAQSTVSLRILYNATQDTTLSIKERQKAVDELQRKFPAYFKSISDENILNGKAAAQYRDLAESIAERARVSALEDEIKENEKLIRTLDKREELNNKALQAAKAQEQVNQAINNQSKEQLDFLQAQAKARLAGGNVLDVRQNPEAFTTPAEGEEKRLKNSNELRAAALEIDLKRNNALRDQKDITQVIEGIVKKSGTGVLFDDTKEIKQSNAELNRRLSLLNKIRSLIATSTTNTLSDEEAPVQKVRDDFKKVFDEIQTFNANPDNKIKIGAELVDQATGARDTLINSIRYDQNTTKLKEQLEREKVLYQEFEAYRTALGKAEAERRFKGELDTQRRYLQRIEAERISLQLKSDLSGEEKNRLKALDKIAKEALLQQQQQFDDLLIANRTYETERSAIVEQYQKDRARLAEQGRANEIAQLDRTHQLRLNSLDDQNAEQLSSFKALFTGIDRLGDQAARNVINGAQSTLNGLVKEGKISEQLATEISERLTDASKSLAERLPDNLLDIGSELQSLSGQVGDIGEGFGMWLSSLGGIVSGLGRIGSGINNIKSLAKGDILGGITGGLGLAGAALSIGNVISGIFNKSNKQAEYAAQLQQQQNDAVNKSLDRQLALIDKIYSTDKIQEYKDAIGSITDAIEDVTNQLSGKFRLTGDKAFDEIITRINNGQQAMVGISNKNYIKARQKEFDELKLPLNDFAALQALLASGSPLDEGTKNLIQGLVDLKQKAIDAGNAIKQTATGTSFESLADSFVSLFDDGKASAEEFGKNFQEIIKDAVLQGFKTKILATQLQKFYDDLADFSQSGKGLDDTEIETLRTAYAGIIAGGNTYFENLKKLGIDLGNLDPTGGGSSSIKSIGQQITEETGTELSGRLLGVQLGVLDTNRILRTNAVFAENTVNLLEDMGGLTLDIRDGIFRIADNTAWLAGIARSLSNIEAAGGQSLVAAGVRP